MHSRPALAAVEDFSLPRALVIGDDGASERLAQVLRQSGCFVEIREQNFGGQGKYDYVFQFGNLFLAPEVRKRHLKPEGKFLFIETDKNEAELFEKFADISILRVGATYVWEVNALCDTILAAMFAVDGERITDMRKRPPSTLSTPPPPQPESMPTDMHEVNTSAGSPPPILEHTRRHGKVLFMCLLFFLVFIISSAFAVWWYISSVQSIISSTRSHIASSDWKGLQQDFVRARKKHTTAKKVYQVTYTILIPFRNSQSMKDIDDVLRLTERLIDTGEASLTFFQQFSLSKTGAFSGTTGFTQQDFTLAEKNLDEMITTLADSKKRVTSMTLPYFPKEQVGVFINTSLDKLLAVRQVMPIAQKLFLTETPKVYLVLFQNTMELRPTGGFIGSFGLLTVHNGKILDLKIQDVYTADGQLQGHVDPPAPLRKYMDQPNWFLRDSNFDPDFSLSAQQAAWFLQKEIGVTVDGVIGVNLFVAQNVLRVVGAVTLPDFNNEIIHADNFFFQAQRYTKKDFFPGSTQKKDFLTAISKHLMAKLKEGEKIQWFSLFNVLKDGLDQKHIQLYVLDADLQKIIETSGWGGRMVDVKCVNRGGEKEISADSCYADYLSINEANIGVNKANYFVTKSVQVDKKIETDGRLMTMVTITYQNTGISDIFQGGVYTNYLRLLVPHGSELVGASFNTVPIPQSEIDGEGYGSDKRVFGTLIKIPPNTTGVVRVGYKLTRPLTFASKYFQFFYQKQGGDKSSPLTVTMTSVPQFPLTSLNFTAQSKETNLTYTSDTSVDRVFAFEIGKK